jgi:hypothetical protein
MPSYNQICNPITAQYFTFLDMDMMMYDVHIFVCKCQPGDQILLNIWLDQISTNTRPADDICIKMCHTELVPTSHIEVISSPM